MHFPWSANTDKERPYFPFISLIITLLVTAAFIVFPLNDSEAAKLRKKSAKTQKASCSKAKKKTFHKKKAQKGSKRKKIIARKSRSAEEAAPFVPDSNPLMKVVPLEDRKYLLEPLDHTSWNKIPDEAKNLFSDPFSAEADTNASILGSLEVSDLNVSPSENQTQAVRQETAKEEKEEGYYGRFTSLIVGTVKQLIGAPYKFGGTSILKGIDCSAFVREVFSKFAVKLPRSSREQVKVGILITDEYDRSKLRIGDLLFFRLSPTSKQIGHAGIYIGNGKMAHAARGNKSVTISSLDKDYYKKTFVAAKRIFVFTEPKSNKT